MRAVPKCAKLCGTQSGSCDSDWQTFAEVRSADVPCRATENPGDLAGTTGAEIEYEAFELPRKNRISRRAKAFPVLEINDASPAPSRVRTIPPEGEIREATEFVWRDPSSIPPCPWVYGRHLIRKQISVTVAPGAVGKSSLSICEALSMASGRRLLGDWTADHLKVWLFNLEDPRDEMDRRLVAAMQHHGVRPEEIEGHPGNGPGNVSGANGQSPKARPAAVDALTTCGRPLAYPSAGPVALSGSIGRRSARLPVACQTKNG
jgi:hypothetical protein